MAGETFSQNYDAITDSNGRCVITIQPTTNLRPWNVTQVSIEMPGATGFVTAVLRKNGDFITPLVAVGDAAAGEPSITLAVSDVLTVEWGGAVPGAQGKALVLYQEEIR